MKLLIVDDSAVMRNVLNDIISQISGIDATKEIMKERPTAILIFSGELDAKNSFEAIQNGAVEVFKKPSFDVLNDDDFLETFKQKLFNIADARVNINKTMSIGTIGCHDDNNDYKICLIGASTGGPVAVKTILSQLPKTFPIGIAVVQHLEKGFEEGYADWLDKGTSLTVRLAKHNDIAIPGEVLVSPIEKHLKIEGDIFVLDDGPAVLNQKPSVDILFESAAKSYREKVLAILLTGMGRDGANGCVAIKEKQGFTIAQDEKSSTIFGMPKAAIEQAGACKVLPLNEIAAFLADKVGG